MNLFLDEIRKKNVSKTGQGGRKLKLLMLIFSFTLVIPFLDVAEGAGVGKSGTIVARKGKAASIAELVAMYDSSSCNGCHSEIHEQWSRSLHSKSIFGTGRTAATIKTTIENGLKKWPYSGVEKPEDAEVEHLMLCAKCHLPQLADATDDVAREIVRNIYDWIDGDIDVSEKAEEALQSLNIGCLICHNRNAITHKWTDGYPQEGVVYGSKNGAHASPDFAVLKKSPIMSESILCGQCHGLGPNLELDNPSQCATLYGYYLWSYQAEGGTETCQDCHMKKSNLGHDIQAYRSPEMQEMALDFHVETTAYQWRDGSKMVPLADVVVSMTNRAGHAIPDG